MQPTKQNTDVVVGARAIGEVVGLDKRAARYLLERGALPARKVGGRWFGWRQALLATVMPR